MGPLFSERGDLVIQDMGKAELLVPSLPQPLEKHWPLGRPGSLQEARNALGGRGSGQRL